MIHARLHRCEGFVLWAQASPLGAVLLTGGVGVSRVPEPWAHLLLGAAAFGSGACCLLLLCGLLASRGRGREVADSPLCVGTCGLSLGHAALGYFVACGAVGEG